MVRVRIYTERKRLRRVKFLVQEYFDSYTLIKTQGVWKGTSEKSLIIEIVVGDYTLLSRHIETVCSQICGMNEQDTCLVTYEDVVVNFNN